MGQAGPSAALPALRAHSTGCLGGAGARTPCPTVGGDPAQRLSLRPAHSTRLEKAKWLHDLNAAIDAAKTGSALVPPARVLCPLPRGEC